jgi:hypothetical protein
MTGFEVNLTASWDRAAVVALERRFPGVRAWHGLATGTWWAVLRDVEGWRLVEARSAEELGRAVEQKRQRVPPVGRSAGGSWLDMGGGGRTGRPLNETRRAI